MKELFLKHMEKYPWCAWTLVITGLVLLILGLIFNALTIKVLWVIIAIVAIIFGGLGLYFKYSEKPTKPESE